MVFVYQHVGGLNSYDRVVLAPVNIFFECIKEGLSNREKGGCPLTAIPGSGSSNAIPGGVGSWALDPFGPGERVTLGRSLVNQLVAPLVEVSGPFFVA